MYLSLNNGPNVRMKGVFVEGQLAELTCVWMAMCFSSHTHTHITHTASAQDSWLDQRRTRMNWITHIVEMRLYASGARAATFAAYYTILLLNGSRSITLGNIKIIHVLEMWSDCVCVSQDNGPDGYGRVGFEGLCVWNRARYMLGCL